MPEMSAAELIRQLRKMHGHVKAKDKAILVAAIGAITDLSVQLFSATHPNLPPIEKPKRGAKYEIHRVEDPDDEPTHPQAGQEGPSARPVESAHPVSGDASVLAGAHPSGVVAPGLRALDHHAGPVEDAVPPVPQGAA